MLRKYLGIHNLENVIRAMNGATLLKCTFFSYFRELYNVKMVTKNLLEDLGENWGRETLKTIGKGPESIKKQ